MAQNQLATILAEDGGFPHDQIFTSLLALAREIKQVIVHDGAAGVSATYDQFITDVIHTRHALREKLALCSDSLTLEEGSLVCILAPANYEFAVAAFSILALGGMVVPLPTSLPPKRGLGLVAEKPDEAYLSWFKDIQVAPIEVLQDIPETIWQLPIQTDERISFPETYPATVFFSSGAEIIDPSAGPEHYWKLLRARRVTNLTTSVLQWERLAQYYRDCISHLPENEKQEYIQGAQSLRGTGIGGSVPPSSLLRFWKKEIGVRLLISYGSTEIGKAIAVAYPDETSYQERCLGKQRFPTSPIKLSEGDHGEILVGGVKTFIGYLNDESSLTEYFDEEGYYKTGDIAHKKDEFFMFDGRASIDFIKTAGGPVPVLQLEKALNELSYVQEAYVIPVEDQTVGKRVGVLVRFTGKPIGLAQLRNDLALHVSPHMLPSAFRALGAHDVIPRTHSEKISKKDVLKQFFPFTPGVGLPKDVELWSLDF
ncbi:hypothetical protein N7523_002304 [Penicillium sp. IBT 18751x]|nr:hypothetical protein N7523_002304 [Penicillium sp. IBT 18751x]